MGGTKFETRKRLEIAKSIARPLESIVEGAMLGGSMGFGQNYSVTPKSDLDFVFVIDPAKLDRLSSKWFFNGSIPHEADLLFKTGGINLFWITKQMCDVEVNSLIYSIQGFTDFCLMNGDLKGFIGQGMQETQTGYGFDGKPIIFNRDVHSFGNGLLYHKPALVDGRYWGGVPRQDFFYSSHIVVDNGEFFSNLEKQVWRATIAQLVKEHGPRPDLTKFNILNTHFTYQTSPKKLNPSVISLIRSRTEQELKRCLSNQKRAEN